MRNIVGAILAMLLLSVPSTAMAQQVADDTTPPVAANLETLASLSAQERAELLSRLSDEQARALLLDYLKAGAGEAADEADPAIEQLEAQSERFRENFAAVLKSAPELTRVPAMVYDLLTAGRDPLRPLYLLLFLAVILGLAYAVERLFRRMLAALRTRLAAVQADADFLERFGRISGLLIVDLLGLAIFLVAAVILFLLVYEGHEPTRLFVLTVLSATVLLRFVVAVSRAVFGDADGSLRLMPVDPASARTAHRHVVASGVIGAFGFLGCDLLRMYGLGDDPHRLMTFVVGTLFTLSVLVGIWRVRHGIAAAILPAGTGGESGSGALQAIVGLWHVPVMLYLVVIYAMAVFNGFSGQVSGTYPGLLSILMIAILPLADRLLCAAMDRFLGSASDAADASRRILRRAMHILVVVLGIGVLAAIWRADIFDLAEAGIGGRAVRALLDIALTGFVGYVAWGLLNAALVRHMPAQADAETGGDEGGGAATTRAGTVLPLFMRFAQIAIAVIVVMVALSALGVNIGPLLAGAGVIGIAIGFGAQTLVRDLVSGLFFLIDDAFRRGEYVDLGGIKGTVEKINMRSLVLRHHLGMLHTVPYGEIQHLTNFSRDWVIMKLEFRVSYDTDPNKVKKIFKQIGKEMLEHPELGQNFIEPFKSQGVKAMEESAMIVRGKFMAKPGTQFTIRKELYNRVQKAFQENGIEFAHRRVQVDLPPDLDLQAEKKKEIAEVAGAAAFDDKDRAKAGG